MLPRLTEQYHNGWYHPKRQAAAETQVQSDLSAKDQSFVNSVEEFLADQLQLTVAGNDPGQFIRSLSERGWSVPRWPRRWGGAGLSPREAWLLDRALGLHGAPQLDPGMVDLIGPLLMRLADDELLGRWLPAIARGESRWAIHPSLQGSDPVPGALVGDRFVPSSGRLNLRNAAGAERLILLARDGSVADIVSAELTAADLLPGALLDPDQVDTEGLTFARLETNLTVAQLAELLDNLTSGQASRARSWTGRLRFRLEALRAEARGTEAVSPMALAELSVALLGLEVLEHRAQEAESDSLARILSIRSTEIGRQLLELTIEALGYYALAAPDPGLQHNELPAPAMAGQDAIGELIRYVGGPETMAARDRLYSSAAGPRMGKGKGKDNRAR